MFSSPLITVERSWMWLFVGLANSYDALKNHSSTPPLCCPLNLNRVWESTFRVHCQLVFPIFLHQRHSKTYNTRALHYSCWRSAGDHRTAETASSPEGWGRLCGHCRRCEQVVRNNFMIYLTRLTVNGTVWKCKQNTVVDWPGESRHPTPSQFLLHCRSTPPFGWRTTHKLKHFPQLFPENTYSCSKRNGNYRSGKTIKISTMHLST